MRYQLFGIGLKGKSPSVTAQRRINCYTEIQKEVDRTNLAIYGTPGLTLFSSAIGSQTSRGVWAMGNYLYSVNYGTLWQFNNAGVNTNLGTLSTTSGDVSMCDNGTQLIIVDGTTKGYIYNTVTLAFTSVTLPIAAQTVTFQDQFFIITQKNGRMFNLSALNDGTTWSATSQALAESSPGSLQAGIADHSILCLFGDVYTEFWQDTGGLDFAYSRIPGSSAEFGLAAPWSLSKHDNSVVGLFRNKMGEVQVSRLSGFHLQRISNFELESIINGYIDKGITIGDATGFSYMLGGHPMYQLNFPSAGTSFLYNGATPEWNELQDYTSGRHWSNKFANYLNQRIVSDYRNGNLYKIDPTVYTDNGSPIPLEIWSKHLWQDDKYLSVGSIQIDIESGVGTATGQGSNPQMMLSVSKDGGKTFGSEQLASMGAIGNFIQRARWIRQGRARDWIFKIRVTDPVKRVLTGSSMEVTGGTS